MDRNTNLRIIAIVVCVVLVAGLGVALGVLAHKVKTFNAEMGAIYDSAYYATLDGLGDTENKLMKVQVSNYNKTKKDLLQEVYTNCEVMSVSLARLNNEEFDSTKLMKFVNQLGGFSSYLSKKLPDESITTEENTKLLKLTEVVTALEKAFAEAGDKVALGGNLYSTLQEGIDTLQGVYDAFDMTTVDYPEMIYDGPFSDGLLDREAKFLGGKQEVDRATAKERVEALYGTTTDEGEVSGAIPSYLFSIGEGSVEVSKVGGYIVELALESDDGEINYTKEQIMTSTKDFLNTLGYTDMEAVWVSVNGDMAYINFAYVKDSVIYYPDLIKAKVSLVDARVIGIEAQNYLYNHVDRTPITERGNADEISLKEGFEVVAKRMAVIPTEWNTEQSVYEIAGRYNGAFYYLYYDIVTLEEIKVMRVIQDENQGELIV